jgi:putative transposase
MVSPEAKRRALGYIMSKGVSRRLGCKVVGLSRGASRHEPKDKRPWLRVEVLRLAEENPRYGSSRICELLGPGVNHKAVHRIWKAEGLSLATKKRIRVEARRDDAPKPTAFGEVWSVDFASQQLESGRQSRIVGLLDVATRQCLLLKARPSIRACDLVKELAWLFMVYGKPKKVRFDNGPEFRSKRLQAFLAKHGVEAGYIEPGSPWQNGHIESFFGKLRDELLNMEVFPTGKDLNAHLGEFQDHYNNRRPHSALGGQTPASFKEMTRITKEVDALTF